MDLRKTGQGDMHWSHLAQDTYLWRALVNMVMNFPVPKNDMKFFSSCTTGGFSKRAQLHGVRVVTKFLDAIIPTKIPRPSSLTTASLKQIQDPTAQGAALTAKNATKLKLPKQYKQRSRPRNKGLSTYGSYGVMYLQ
jgi:hypothetical protein